MITTLKDNPKIEYDTDNFNVQILNDSILWDYRSACKITEGILFKNGQCCTNFIELEDGKCKKGVTKEESKKCWHNDCINNISWCPKDMTKFWKKQILANHSPIRSIYIRIIDLLPKSVYSQLVRHTAGHPQPYIQSSRPDWTGKERSNDPYENRWCMFDFTPESFILMAQKRLCNRTEIMTRKIVSEWVNKLRIIDTFDRQDNCVKELKDLLEVSLLKALGELSVPRCEYLGANKCPEIKGCGKYESFII
jgi:hypothetical protein